MPKRICKILPLSIKMKFFSGKEKKILIENSNISSYTWPMQAFKLQNIGSGLTCRWINFTCPKHARYELLPVWPSIQILVCNKDMWKKLVKCSAMHQSYGYTSSWDWWWWSEKCFCHDKPWYIYTTYGQVIPTNKQYIG